MRVEIRYYQTSAGRKPFATWLENLNDRQARARIYARLSRVALGNLGDLRSVGDGIFELRIDWGPGYRIYFAREEELVILFLCAGDKRTQQRDIHRAKTYVEDYKARLNRQTPRSGA
jgi:putative addiction module killer protein